MTSTAYTNSEFADDKNLGRIIGMADGCAAFQVEFNRPGKCTNRNCIKLIKGYASGNSIREISLFLRWQILDPGRITPHTNESWGLTHWKAVFKKVPRAFWWTRSLLWVAMCPCNKEVQPSPGLHEKGRCLPVEEDGPSPLLSISETHLKFHFQVWALWDERGIAILEWVQCRTTKVIKRPE